MLECILRIENGFFQKYMQSLRLEADKRLYFISSVDIQVLVLYDSLER